MNITIFQNKWFKSVTFATLAGALFTFIILCGAGRSYGNLFWNFYPSHFFGVPEEHKQKLNLSPLFITEAGWDGQFYYYISNDIFGVKDTKDHVDATSYRYQRIGLPLVAKAGSLLIGSSIVSPGEYFSAHLFVLWISLIFIAVEYRRRNIKVVWLWIWCVNVGVLSSLKHGLPDAGGDALACLAFLLFLNGSIMRYTIIMSLAVLFREGFVVLAFGIFCWHILSLFSRSQRKSLISNVCVIFTCAIPGILFVALQLALKIKFGVFAFQQSGHITDWFLFGFYKSVLLHWGNTDRHGLVYLVTHITLLAGSALFAVKIGMKRNSKVFVLLPYIFLLSCFGIVVMGYYRDFAKGTAFLWLVLPLFTAYGEIYLKPIKYFGIAIFCLNIFSYATKEFKTPGGYIPGQLTDFRIQQTNEGQNSCLSNFESNIKISGHQDNPYQTIHLPTFVSPKYVVYDVEVQNLSDEIWYNGNAKEVKGRVYLSYQWYLASKTNEVIMDGVRSPFLKPIEPGTSVKARMIVKYPWKPGNYLLRISLVQEDCHWFYKRSGGSSTDLKVKIE